MEKIKKQKSHRRSYGPLVLWLEDLTEIVTFLKENTKKVEISNEDYRFQSIDDLKEHFGSQTQFALAIDSTDPYVSIEFTHIGPRLYVAAGVQAAHLFHEIDNMLSQRQRWFPWAYSFWFMMVFPAAVFAGDYFLLRGRPETVAQILSQMTAVLSLWGLWACYVRLFRECVIKLHRRADRKPFFERNQDQLIMLFLGVVLGGIVTFAGVMAKEHFYPSGTAIHAPNPT
jgi:hypothetical protein